MRFTTTGFALFVLALAVLLGVLGVLKEGFGSPGTYVQLATSHVPTERDAYYYSTVYPEEVRKGLKEMTGSDPGPIPTYLSPYSGTYYLW